MIKPVHTDLFAVIGNPVRHSLSPVMMNAAFKALNIPAVYVALQADQLAEDLKTLSLAGFRGLSVTVPHKELAFRFAHEVDEVTEFIGAVNTLMRRGSAWVGINTDWMGASKALSKVTPIEGKRVLVLGAGGAARAVTFGLKRQGANVTVCNRCVEKGMALAKLFRCEFVPLALLEKIRRGLQFDIIVQCTSAGLTDNEPTILVSESFFHPGMVVMDAVYRPPYTPFLLSARKAGATVISGIEMLLYQGVEQLEWWFSMSIPESPGISAMREALLNALSEEEKCSSELNLCPESRRASASRARNPSLTVP